MSETVYLGSCLCGQVKYKIECTLAGLFLCHCSRCRKASGSSNAANAFTKDGKLAWISGKENQKLYNLPETRFTRNFCITCGSSLPYQLGESSTVVIPAGSLDSDINMKPTAHIFYASRANWDQNLDLIEKRDEFSS